MKAALLCLVIMAYLLADSTTAQSSTFDIKCGVEELKKDVISRMETADKKLDELEVQHNEHKKEMLTRMDTVDEKLGNVEEKLDELEVQHNEHKKEVLTRMDAEDEKLDDLKQLLEQVIANKVNPAPLIDGPKDILSPQWISIQRRGQYGNPADFFSKSMAEYKTGFGTVDKEFWLGLNELARLTREGDWMMKVTMMDYDGKTYTGTYNLFRVSAGPRFELEVGGYDDDQSTIGKDVFRLHNKMAFSTKDVDQDTHTSVDCSNTNRGQAGWWFANCAWININGQNLGNNKVDWEGMAAYVGKTPVWVKMKESEMFIKKSPKM